MSSKLYSQKIIVNGNDTLICFSKKEARIILKEINKQKYYDSLNKICQEQISKYALVVQKMDSIALLQKNEIDNKEQIISNQIVELNSKNTQISELTNSVKVQKRQKIIAIVCGSITTAGSLYLWVSK
jgi:phosphotransacetylase